MMAPVQQYTTIISVYVSQRCIFCSRKRPWATSYKSKYKQTRRHFPRKKKIKLFYHNISFRKSNNRKHTNSTIPTHHFYFATFVLKQGPNDGAIVFGTILCRLLFVMAYRIKKKKNLRNVIGHKPAGQTSKR